MNLKSIPRLMSGLNLILFMVAMAMTACQSGESNGSGPIVLKPGNENSQGQSGFQSIYAPVIGPKCANCHSQAAGNRGQINLETYEDVFQLKEAVAESVQSGMMPLASAPALTAAEKQALLSWIAAGAPFDANTEPVPSPQPSPEPGPGSPTEPKPDLPPETAPQPAPEQPGPQPAPEIPVPQPEPVRPAPPAPELPSQPPMGEPEILSFANVFEKVIGPRCVSCHGTRGGVSLETYEEVFANRQIVLEVVQEGYMPPPRKGALTPEQKNLLIRWIEAGAPLKVVEP